MRRATPPCRVLVLLILFASIIRARWEWFTFYSIYFLIYKEAFRVLCAMAADKATQELSLKVLEHLSAAQATLKANQRKAVIASEASKFKNAATKRKVRYNRELLDNIEDMVISSKLRREQSLSQQILWRRQIKQLLGSGSCWRCTRGLFNMSSIW